MKCVMCPCTDISLLKLQTYINHKTLKEIAFILPDFAIPDSQAPVFICVTCLGEVASFYTIKKLCLNNLSRLSCYNVILKDRYDSNGSDLKVVINRDEVWAHQKLHIKFKINVDHENSLLSENQEASNSSIDKESKTQVVRKKRRFECRECNKVFAQSRALIKHTRIHTGEKPYKCPTCQKSFTRLTDLNRHKLTHTGEKSHQCDNCHKTFALHSNLIIHKRSHSNVRPFSCTVCNMAFTHSGHLSRHMRTHTGEKPHQCPMCDYTCIQSSVLKQHSRTHSGEKPYTCKFCYKSFTQSSSLNQHERTFHNEEHLS